MFERVRVKIGEELVIFSIEFDSSFKIINNEHLFKANQIITFFSEFFPILAFYHFYRNSTNYVLNCLNLLLALFQCEKGFRLRMNQPLFALEAISSCFSNVSIIISDLLFPLNLFPWKF